MMLRLFRLLAAYLLVSAAAGCHTTRPQPDERPNAQMVTPPVGLDTATVVVQPPRTLLQKLTGKPAAPAYRLPAATPVRIGKKSQVTIQYGNGNTSTQSTTAKKAQSATGDGAKVAVAGKNSTQATDSAQALNTGGGAAATGAGSHAEGGAVVTKPGFWNSPAGYTVLAVLVGIGLYGLYLAWPVLVALLPKRRKDPVA